MNQYLFTQLLRRENLDLQLTPYCVLATSTRHGFVEYVESRTVADVLKEEGSIQNYFRKCAPCDNGPYGIDPEVMDNYVKSCGTSVSYCTFIRICISVFILYNNHESFLSIPSFSRLLCYHVSTQRWRSSSGQFIVN